jgi:hypothetical protein
MTTLMNLGEGLSRPARFILAYILWVGYCDLQQATTRTPTVLAFPFGSMPAQSSKSISNYSMARKFHCHW